MSQFGESHDFEEGCFLIYLVVLVSSVSVELHRHFAVGHDASHRADAVVLVAHNAAETRPRVHATDHCERRQSQSRRVGLFRVFSVLHLHEARMFCFR